jgi:hypothetical protein
MKYKWLTLALLAITGLYSSVSAQKVTLDYYFNHEVYKTASGKTERYHYLWDEKANSGFSIFGDAFKRAGATLDTLGEAPTTVNLKGTSIYIIVDPDTKKESPTPNYIQQKDINEIAAWVKGGGVLVMMHFNNDLQNHVINDDHFEDGAIITTGNPIFKTAGKIFMKDACSISITGAARAGLKNSSGAVIMATAKYGKGTVFAVGDPWLYNEYTNGRLPSSFENDKAANDVAKWLIGQARR